MIIFDQRAPEVWLCDAAGGQLDGRRFVVLRIPVDSPCSNVWCDLAFEPEEVRRIALQMLDAAARVEAYRESLDAGE